MSVPRIQCIVGALALTGSLLLGASVRAATPPSDGMKKAGEISFCTRAGQPPAVFFAADGKTLQGLEVDLMKALGDEFKLRTRIANFETLEAMFEALDAGKCDAVVANTSKNPQRLKKYLFVDYMEITGGMLVAKGNPHGIRMYEDLSGKRVGVAPGTAGERRLKVYSDQLAGVGKPAIQMLPVDGNTVIQKEIEQNRFDAFAAPSLILAYLVSQSGGKLEIGGLPQPPTTLGIMLPKDENAKAAAIKTAYDALVKNGKVAGMVSKWGVEKALLLCDDKHKCD